MHTTKRHLAQILYKKNLQRDYAMPKTAKSICSLLHKYNFFLSRNWSKNYVYLKTILKIMTQNKSGPKLATCPENGITLLYLPIAVLDVYSLTIEYRLRYDFSNFKAFLLCVNLLRCLYALNNF